MVCHERQPKYQKWNKTCVSRCKAFSKPYSYTLQRGRLQERMIAYFAHPEWVLFTMLPDTNHHVRSGAVKLIHRTRKHCESKMRSDQLESDSDGAKGGTGGDNGSEDDLSDQNVEEDGVPIDIEIRYYKVPTLNKLTGMPIAIL